LMVCGFLCGSVWIELWKSVSFSQVLRTEPQMIAISAQNRSSAPLRLHQNK